MNTNNNNDTEKDLVDKTAGMSISGQSNASAASGAKKPVAGGGGGGPAMTFKSSFNIGASEFVPSWGAPAPAAAAPAAPAPGAAMYGGAAAAPYGYGGAGTYGQQHMYQYQQPQQGYYGAPGMYTHAGMQYQQPQQGSAAHVQQPYYGGGQSSPAVPQQPKPQTAAVNRPASASMPQGKTVSLSNTGAGGAKVLSISSTSTVAPKSVSVTESTAPTKPKSVEEPKKAASVSSSPARDKNVENVKPTEPAKPVEPVVAPEPVADDDDEDCDPVSLGRKEHLNIIFLGHVDAGKSTMGGHILYLTGMVDKRTMEKYEREAKELGRESWYLSWALDLNQEERNKGKTTEYGRGYFETERRRFTIIDAPGHKTFVPSMIEGAAQADVGILVISARKGEFETGFEKGGQTREHALLAKTAGVRHLVVVINKMDDPTVGFSQDRYNECVDKISPFLKQVGYQKSDVDFMPVSGFTGANLRDRLDSGVCGWYSGPSLLELLNDMKLDRDYKGKLLMPIAGKLKDMGTIILGKLESGHMKKGQTILIMPNKRTAEITAIFQEDVEVPAAYTGDNVRIRVRGIEEEDVMPGFVLCTPKYPVHAVTAFEAQLAIFDYKSIICAGYSAVMHIHTATEEVTLSDLLHMIDKKTGRKSKMPPKFVKKGDSCIARIEMQQSVCMEMFGDVKQLGRFTLRDEGVTIAVGKVIRLITESV